jgi:surface protein
MVNYNFSAWNTANLVDMYGIFNSNRALKVIDLSDFDTQKVEDFSQLFDGASSLETVIGMDQWDTSSGKYFVELFTGTQVREVDLSSFDMSKAEQTYNMFLSNPQLTTIYVSDKWNLDPSKVTSSGNMFGYNPKLTGGNGSTTATLKLTDVTYANVDTPETPGYLTHIKDKPVDP